MGRSYILVAALIASASCLPGDPSGNEYMAPGPTDQRSACPFMNTLANHGFIKRSGIAVTRAEVNNAFDVAFNVDPAISDGIFTTAVTGTTSQIPDTINYADLNQHGLIEHDGSLSRDDAAIGNNAAFNETIWNQMTMFFTTPLISIEQMAGARVSRINHQRAANPVFLFDDKVGMTSLAETALVLMTFSNGSIDGGANRQQVDTFFRQERLPFDQGYNIPTQRLTQARVQALGQRLSNSTGASAPSAGSAGSGSGSGTGTGTTTALGAGNRVVVDLAACVMTLTGITWMLL